MHQNVRKTFVFTIIVISVLLIIVLNLCKRYLNSSMTGFPSTDPREIPDPANPASNAPISLAVRKRACSLTGLCARVRVRVYVFV